MAHLHLLGTGGSVTDPHRTTTMLAAADPDAGSLVLIDCGGDVVHRALRAGLDLGRLNAVVLTHAHADHLSGFPLMMQKLWLHGRRDALPICGPAPALAVARKLWDAFDTSGWEGLPPLDWRQISLEKDASVFENDTWRVTGSPVQHSKPTLGLRFEHVPSGRCAAYSCDTEPCEAVVELARGCGLLVHEANGAFSGHSTATQAAGVGAKAGVERVVLVHLPPDLSDEALEEARGVFPNTELGEELGAYEV